MIEPNGYEVKLNGYEVAGVFAGGLA